MFLWRSWWTVLGGIAAVVGTIVALLTWLLPQSAAPAAIAPPSSPAVVTTGPTDAVSPPEAPPSDETPSTDPASEETPSSSGGASVPHGPVTYSTRGHGRRQAVQEAQRQPWLRSRVRPLAGGTSCAGWPSNPS